MHNLIVIFAMFMIYAVARDRRLLLIIGSSCMLLDIVHYSKMDIALYYGVAAMISVITAVVALCVVKATASKVLAVFMLMQAIICLCLVPDWSFTANESLQFKLNQFNDILVFILISLGIASSDRYRDNC